MRFQQADLDRMVRVLRHRLRNHVSGLKTAVDLLESELKTEREGIKEFFPLLRRECMLIDELSCRVGFAVEDRADGGTADAVTVLDRVFARVRKSFSSISINSDCDGWFGLKVDHSVSLENGLYELTANAAEAGRGAGIDVCAKMLDDEMVFVVRDYGPQISEDDFNSMRLPFFTTKSRHIGIGLNIMENALRHVDGKMKISQKKEPSGIEVKVTFKNGSCKTVL